MTATSAAGLAAWPSSIDPLRYCAWLSATLPRLAPLRLGRHARLAVLDAALDRASDLPGMVLEFGVYKGVSLRRAAKRQPRRLYHGFDSFQGFPEDGRPDWDLDLAAIAPRGMPANCALHAGWFADTVPPFLAAHPGPIALVHVDCDILSATRDCMMPLAGRIGPGTVICFDELLNYHTWLWNETLALFEWLEATGLGLDWIALHDRVRPVEVTLALLDARRYPPWEADVKAGFCRPAACVLTEANTDMHLLEDRHERARLRSMAARLVALSARLAEDGLPYAGCDPDDPLLPPAPARAWWQRG